MFSVTRFCDVLERLGAKPQIEVPEQLIAAYSEGHRYYHTGQHIAECLRNLDNYRDAADRPDEIEMAIWFHDAVYETRNNDNEEASAAWARQSLSQAGLKQGATTGVVEMVLATKGHVGTTADERLLLDIDLSILGADPEIFKAYDEAIRKEYIWVAEADYRARRAKVLSTFLDRPYIYGTPHFRATHESKARENINAAILRLGT